MISSRWGCLFFGTVQNDFFSFCHRSFAFCSLGQLFSGQFVCLGSHPVRGFGHGHHRRAHRKGLPGSQLSLFFLNLVHTEAITQYLLCWQHLESKAESLARFGTQKFVNLSCPILRFFSGADPGWATATTRLKITIPCPESVFFCEIGRIAKNKQIFRI